MPDVEKARRLVTELVEALGFTEADVFSLHLTPKEARVDRRTRSGEIPARIGSMCRGHTVDVVHLLPPEEEL